ncbi:hypothetical protein EDD16DRAFT_62378 [Pisolithus croceorrhizus]|nr:hypothetical protein EDD16DRAFT_62378 [Pisolithus croceorrhizus]KAI6124897.1 hypothetical protein EV401DRAFT_1150690 [Pisolithus croceorrhizus]KAI6160639.1 hypothetical protein EDD17DRAFT_1598102 [Pisolithus thermaeus]
MANEPLHGPYHIISSANNNSLGLFLIINPPNPPPPPGPARVILLRPEVLPHQFMVEQVHGKNNTYVIENTRGQDDRVFDFANEPAEEWVICHREFQDAYTIERRCEPERTGEPLAWTAPPDDESVASRQILLRPLILEPSNPPRFPPSQLFRFHRVREE